MSVMRRAASWLRSSAQADAAVAIELLILFLIHTSRDTIKRDPELIYRTNFQGHAS